MEALTIEDLNPPEVVEAVLGKKKAGGRKHIQSRRIQIDGIWFDSLTEGRRYEYLYALQVAGEITDLVIHPQYVVVPGYTSSNGKKTATVKFKPDFRYIRDGKVIVEDVKGIRKTKKRKTLVPQQSGEFTLRRKIFQQQNPGVHFQLVCEIDGQWTVFLY